MKLKGPTICKLILKKNKTEGNILPNFKTDYKVKGFKTVWHLHKNIEINEIEWKVKK